MEERTLDPAAGDFGYEVAALAGEEITIIPHRGVGESRDTEAGLQPWKATLIGYDADEDKVVVRVDSEERLAMKYRGLRAAPITVHPARGLTLGEW